jgi:hypothetical protein
LEALVLFIFTGLSTLTGLLLIFYKKGCFETKLTLEQIVELKNIEDREDRFGFLRERREYVKKLREQNGKDGSMMEKI